MVPSLGPSVAALALLVDAEMLGDLIGRVRDSLALAFGQRVEFGCERPSLTARDKEQALAFCL